MWNKFWIGIRWLFDTLFPPSKDGKRIRLLTPDLITKKCTVRVRGDVISLLQYSDPDVRALIHEGKFHYNQDAYKLLAEVCKKYLLLKKDEIILIPIPLSRARYHERGYNQVEEVAKLAIQNLKNVTLNTKILVRTKHTKPQTELKREERLKNVTDAFACLPARWGIRDQKHTETFKGKHIIVLDDVSTTGATLNAAKTCLEKQTAILQLHPASITLLALAH